MGPPKCNIITPAKAAPLHKDDATSTNYTDFDILKSHPIIFSSI